MARWKPIESVPTDRSILVDGGIVENDFDRNSFPQTEPVKVKFDEQLQMFYVDEAVHYAVYVLNPTVWTDLPVRALELVCPRPTEYDL